MNLLTDPAYIYMITHLPESILIPTFIALITIFIMWCRS